MDKVARNHPCPCGSGKKFKSCCGTVDKTRSGAATSKTLGVVVAIVVVVGVLIAVNHFRTADLSAGSSTPEPWEYDAARNMHYNPLPGHEHWHEGPPPDSGSGGVANTATVPLPVQPPPTLPAAQPTAPVEQPAPADGSPEDWEYDEESDRHWNPTTQSWDAGMPPLDAIMSGN